MTCVVDLALEGISRHHRVCLGGVDHAYVTLVFLFASADRATRSLASRGTHHRSTVHGRTEECNRCHVQFHRSIRLHVSVNQLFRRNQTATGIFNSRSPGLTQLDERCDRVVKKQGKRQRHEWSTPSVPNTSQRRRRLEPLVLLFDARLFSSPSPGETTSTWKGSFFVFRSK